MASAAERVLGLPKDPKRVSLPRDLNAINPVWDTLMQMICRSGS
jgi:hypothetical protein